MPHTVRKTRSKTKPWSIVNRLSGRTVGRSSSKRKAQASARIRDASHR